MTDLNSPENIFCTMLTKKNSSCFRRYLNGKRDLVHPNSKGLRLMIGKIFKSKNDHSDDQYRQHQRNSSRRGAYEEKDLMEFSD